MSNIFKSKVLFRHPVDYSWYGGSSFYTNKDVVENGIADVLGRQARNEKFSVGKVIVIGHSMGGILARLYLQSTDYKEDIIKLITLNTPHYGTQIANYFWKRRPLLPAFFSFGTYLLDINNGEFFAYKSGFWPTI